MDAGTECLALLCALLALALPLLIAWWLVGRPVAPAEPPDAS